jgi:hypothetical protein
MLRFRTSFLGLMSFAPIRISLLSIVGTKICVGWWLRFQRFREASDRILVCSRI